jgi:hypothetical protein
VHSPKGNRVVVEIRTEEVAILHRVLYLD